MSPIGVFDSGFGGLTVLRALTERLPQYDYRYLGDNARAPYGTRSFETVYRYTLECVRWLLEGGCPLVILACNTASAKALRTIQQQDLDRLAPGARVLGVIRPTSEVIGQRSRSGTIGILATPGTVQSRSYLLEIEKYFPGLRVEQEACPMWVPLIENGELEGPGTEHFVQRHLRALLGRAPELDTVLLACTHYPLLEGAIRRHLPEGVEVLGQGGIVAGSLEDYLRRHPEMEGRLSRTGAREFFTTDDPEAFSRQGSRFWGAPFTALSARMGG